MPASNYTPNSRRYGCILSCQCHSLCSLFVPRDFPSQFAYRAIHPGTDQTPLCPGPWPWYVWCLLSMKASFKGKRLSCNGEGKVHCFCILFLGPKSCCKFCSIKTRPCCLLSVLPPLLAFPASQYYWLRILKQYNTGLYYFEWKPQRWEIFSCVLCLAWAPPVELLGTSAILHFWFLIFGKVFEYCIELMGSVSYCGPQSYFHNGERVVPSELSGEF